MKRVIVRLAWAIAVAWFVVTATFAMVVAIPADPAQAMLGPHATPEALVAVRAHYCLDRDVLAEYGCYVGHIVRGDLGDSYRSKRAVVDILADHAWPTIELALAALFLQLLVGVSLGVTAAVRRGRWPDRATQLVVLAGQSVPTFFIGTLALYVIAFRWDWLPIGGAGDGFCDRLRHLVLPAATLATAGVAYYARVVRSELTDSLAEDYVRTARAKGLTERRVVWRHALVPALGPVVMLVGLDLGALLGGAVVTEDVFGWPGLGRELAHAIGGVDIPVILGIVLVASLAVVSANLIADLLQLWLDPRVREVQP